MLGKHGHCIIDEEYKKSLHMVSASVSLSERAIIRKSQIIRHMTKLHGNVLKGHCGIDIRTKCNFLFRVSKISHAHLKIKTFLLKWIFKTGKRNRK